MRLNCKPSNDFGRNTAIFIAIFCSLFLTNSNHHSHTHLSLIGGIVAAVVMLAVAIAAILICRQRPAA